MRTTKMRSKLSLLFIALVTLIAVSAAAALADVVSNTVDNSVDSTVENMPLAVGGANGTTTLYVLAAAAPEYPNEPQPNQGCNLSGNNTDLVLDVKSSDTSVATVSPSQVTIASCDQTNGKNITVTPVAQGTATITATKAATGTTASGNFDVSAATFKVTVAPPPNTPPTVSVSGVTGTNYEKGSVPSATCQVSDTEDTNESATPVIDSSGLNSYGLGQEKATCSYTDGGGLTATASVTYNIVDTTNPVVTPPDDVTEEATGPNGAAVSYSGASANDAVYGSITPTCTPASGSTFALGTNTVTCEATDGSGNKGTATFTITVEDTTGPSISGPDDQTLEATGPSGAAASWSAPTASDLVDGSVSVTCDKTSGSTFALGTTTVTCTATDAAGNKSTDTFTITVEDTTAPVIAWHEDVTAEATGSDGAFVSYTYPETTDAVDGNETASCTPASGSKFALGETTVTCSATDAAGNAATNTTFKVTVRDTTAPSLSLPANMTVEATGPSGAAVTYTATASDLVDGNVSVTCSPLSGSTLGLGTTTVTCSATDAHGNKATGSFTVEVKDTTAPSLSLPANMTVTATSNSGAVVTYTATASDLVDGNVPVSCMPASGSTFQVGATPTTVNCSATDAHGNKATGSFTVKVNYGFSGFRSPVDNLPTVNSVKAGSAIPVKFSLGGYQGLNIFSSGYPKATVSSCAANAAVDSIEETVTAGNSSLSYDATADQYNYVWKTEKAWAGKCILLEVKFADGSSQFAKFQMLR